MLDHPSLPSCADFPVCYEGCEQSWCTDQVRPGEGVWEQSRVEEQPQHIETKGEEEVASPSN